MRLGQLARKLAIKPSDIKKHLETQGIDFEGTSNHKVPDELVDGIVAHFMPEQEEVINETEKENTIEIPPSTEESDLVVKENTLAEETPLVDDQVDIIQDATEEDTDKKEEVETDSFVELEEVKTEVVPEPIEPEEVILTVKDILEEEELLEGSDKENSDEEIEEESKTKILIKAPKVSLPGLKVIGKIDLPEPAKKESEEESEDVVEESKDIPSRKRNISQNRPHQRRDSRKNRRNKRKPLTLEEKRQREEKATARKKEATLKKKKEEQKKHYLNQVKQHSGTKPKKNKKIKEETHKKQEVAPPKTIMGKFWRWLNT